MTFLSTLNSDPAQHGHALHAVPSQGLWRSAAEPGGLTPRDRFPYSSCCGAVQSQ